MQTALLQRQYAPDLSEASTDIACHMYAKCYTAAHGARASPSGTTAVPDEQLCARLRLHEKFLGNRLQKHSQAGKACTAQVLEGEEQLYSKAVTHAGCEGTYSWTFFIDISNYTDEPSGSLKS